MYFVKIYYIYYIYYINVVVYNEIPDKIKEQ